MNQAQAGASAPACPDRHFIVGHVLSWAESHPAHQYLTAEVERLKRERKR